MSQPGLTVNKSLLQKCLSWFQGEFRQSTVSMIESQFPNYPLPSEIQSVLDRWDQIWQLIGSNQSETIDVAFLFKDQQAGGPENAALLKQIVLRYRRHRAAETESLRDKTFHLELTEKLDEEINSLDKVTEQEWFQTIEHVRLPRAKDYLPVQFIEESDLQQINLAARQYDEKFHILQAPTLFLQDLAYFRAKCEMRETPLAIAFLDIDDFKNFNTAHTETKVDRNLLPRFMQTIEARVYHHGYGYRQGGDEYLILLPSLSRILATAFLNSLREELAQLAYPNIAEKTTVSIGLCIAEPDCSFTDRKLLDRASLAKKFAKDQGKNRIATYTGLRFTFEELTVVAP